MATFPRERIRLRIDTDAKAGTTAAQDDISGASPDCWKGTNVQLEIGLFFNGELIDITNIQSLTVLGKDLSNKNGDKILEQSISAGSMDATLTQEAWDNKTGQHATIEFTPAEMAIAMNGQDFRDLWLMIHGVSLDGDRLAFGAARLRVFETGIDSGSITPVLGSNLIPGGAVYDGSGNYTLAVTAAAVYDWSKGPDDATLVNGTETISASARFTAQGASVTLTGTPASPVTAVLRDRVYYTAEEVNALIDGIVKIVNKPGAIMWAQSPSGRYLRGLACTDDGDTAFPKIDRNAAP